MTHHVARVRDRRDNKIIWVLLHQKQLYRMNIAAETTAEFLISALDVAESMINEIEQFEPSICEKDLEFLSPITAPCRILAQGSNYPSSRLETGMNPYDKSFNMLFHKSDSSLSPPGSDIVRPAHVQLLDYEVELGLVIGKRIDTQTVFNEDDMGATVAGVVCAQDVTARDVQLPQMQYFKGKSYQTFCPTGPYLCLFGASEYAQLNELLLELSVNGEKRQSDVSSNMLFKPHETLSELSMITTLDPGDLILTGSPGGCALTAPPSWLSKLMGLLPEQLKWKAFVNKQKRNPNYLKPGDQITATIKSLDGSIDLGIQSNRVV